jgi:hypothetical protein
VVSFTPWLSETGLLLSIVEEAEWAPETVGKLLTGEKSITLIGIKPQLLGCPVSSQI